ncbi:methionyl-tRNA synthetase, partial [Perkinsus olseni]
QQILARLEEPLRDLSCSRRTFSWGIPIPGSDDHVMYVWFDALTNYVSAVNGLDAGNDKAYYWPANAHIIGKDIIWFHCVIWPCMLLSAGIPLPESVAVHGFIQDSEGKKMSKSIGNVVDPHDVLDEFPVDTVRWYMLSDAPYGGDLKFSTSAMINTHNADLCNGLGNLVNRAVALSGGSVPDLPVKDLEKPFDLRKAVADLDGKFLTITARRYPTLVTEQRSAVYYSLRDDSPYSEYARLGVRDWCSHAGGLVVMVMFVSCHA